MKTKFHARAFLWNRAIQELFIHPGILLLNLLSFLMIAFFSGTIVTSGFLFLHIAVNFAATVGLERLNESGQRRLLYGLCLALNAGSFLALQHMGFIGILDSNNVNAPATLPFLMGYAFYTLQVLAIQGAIYRRLIQGLSFQRFVLAVSFCGAFLAGPIFNRSQLKDFEDLDISFPTVQRIYEHLHFLIGALLFKYVFANWLSQWVNLLDLSSPLIIARTVLCFELQVYFDFAGYSLLSYFLCRIFGIPMYHNFQQPFRARNIPEFWRRWHVGLGTFFKENVFLPLKDLYPQPMSTRVFLPITVFMLSALWHGPTRNFVLWGLFHGLAFVVAVAALRQAHGNSVLRILNWAFVFVVLFYGRLLFMESDFERLLTKFRQLGHFRQMGHELLAIIQDGEAIASLLIQRWDSSLVGFAIAGLLAFEIFKRDEADAPAYPYLKPGLWAFVLLLFTLLFFQPAHHAGFVYGR